MYTTNNKKRESHGTVRTIFWIYHLAACHTPNLRYTDDIYKCIFIRTDMERSRVKKMDLSNGTVYTELYTELEGYERNGVCLLMEGSHVSPMQVVRELMAREEGSYMRDYEMNADGYIESLSFINVTKKNETENEHKPS